MNFNDLINNKKFILNPICAESRGVRSFCTFLNTPDLSILLDPGCALGLRGKYKYPHPFEFEKLYFYTKKILELAKDSGYIFISHYHHDHYKPNIEDNFLIYSNKEIFNDLYQKKIIFAKDIKKNINLNQRERGEAFKRDIEKIDTNLNLITFDSENLPKEFITTNKLIQNVVKVKDTILIFPKEFLHGFHNQSHVYIQPLIVIYHNIAFYYFPDVQGMPNNQDLHDLLEIRSLCHNFIQKYKYENNLEVQHIIAFGGPMTYIFKNQHDKENIINLSLFNTNNLIQMFDISIVDHHILRDQEYNIYWNNFQEVAKLHHKHIIPFNSEILDFSQKGDSQRNNCQKNIFTMECNRDKLYELKSPSETFRKWVYLADKKETRNLMPENYLEDNFI